MPSNSLVRWSKAPVLCWVIIELQENNRQGRSEKLERCIPLRRSGVTAVPIHNPLLFGLPRSQIADLGVKILVEAVPDPCVSTTNRRSLYTNDIDTPPAHGER